MSHAVEKTLNYSVIHREENESTIRSQRGRNQNAPTMPIRMNSGGSTLTEMPMTQMSRNRRSSSWHQISCASVMSAFQ
eukprot:1676263-Amphidinium_carterae.1